MMAACGCASSRSALAPRGARDAAFGRIEAVDATFWFGFRDDVVVRIAAAPGGGSRVDVRSKSRVGRGDAGTNARRIRGFRERLS